MDKLLFGSLADGIGAILLFCLFLCLLYFVIRLRYKQKKLRQLKEFLAVMECLLVTMPKRSELEFLLREQEKTVKEKNSSSWCLAELADLVQIYKGKMEAYHCLNTMIQSYISMSGEFRQFFPYEEVLSMSRKADLFLDELENLRSVLDHLPAFCFNLEKARRMGCEKELLAIYASVKFILKTMQSAQLNEERLEKLFDEIESIMKDEAGEAKLPEKEVRSHLSELAEEWAAEVEKIKAELG
jgi:hypothetical protein